MLLEHWEVTVVIEMVVGEVTSGGMFKVLNWNLHSFRLLEITQVLDSISWVRCASGNVSYIAQVTDKTR